MATCAQSTLLSASKPLTNLTSSTLSRPSYAPISLRSSRSQTLIVYASSEAKPTVLVAEKLGATGLELLKSFASVDCSYNLTQEELCTKISLCYALIVRNGTKVSRDVFESSDGRLKVVARAEVGIDNV